jgi:hypothetical protein
MSLKKTLAILFLTFASNLSLQIPALAGTSGKGLPESVTPAPSDAESLLVELVFNRRSAGNQLCYRQGDDYWIPFELFRENAGLKTGDPSQKTVSHATSLGTITFSSNVLKTFGNTSCISLSELRKTFLVAGRFNPSAFAIQLDIPWYPVSGEKKKATAPERKPDVPAPNSSLSFLRFEPDLSWDFEKTFRKNIYIEAGGRLAGGVWDVTFEGDPEVSFPPTRYHWTTFSRNFALRVGTGSSDIYPLIGNKDFTGIQAGWNNRNILNQLDFDRYSDSDVFLTLDRTQQRTIEGNGPPAAIAELRLDGVVAARQRIGMDGRFLFRNVRMTSELRKTQVYLYKRSLREKPLAVLDYTISVLNRSLPSGEILVRGGAGVSGNPLENSQEKQEFTGFSHLQYGLSNRITLEAGIQYNPETGTPDLLAGSIVSLGPRWVAGFYGARSNGRFGADARLEGHGKAWDISYLSFWHEKGFSGSGVEEEEDHSLRFSTSLLEPFDLLLYGHYVRQSGMVTKKFLLPGVYWTVSPVLLLSAIPDDDEKYRYEADVRIGDESNLSVVYDKDVVTADCRIDFGKSLVSRLLHSYAVKTGDNLSSLFLDWYPGGNQYDLFRFGISHSDGQVGLSGSWSKFIDAGLRFTLQYSYNMNNAHQLETDENMIIPSGTDASQYLAFAMTWDLGFSGKKTYPVNRAAISHTRGGLAGSIDIMNASRLEPSDINDVDILINGQKLGQRQIDGTFFVGNLRPGIYKVDIDTEKLPLELNVAKTSMTAEVKNGAVTEVNFPVYAEYGIAGHVTDGKGKEVADTPVTVRDDKGTVVSRTMTNPFGDYRIDGLRPGNYILQAGSQGLPKPITVKDDFVFDVNLSLPDPNGSGNPDPNSNPGSPAEPPKDKERNEKTNWTVDPPKQAATAEGFLQFGVFRKYGNAATLAQKIRTLIPGVTPQIIYDGRCFKVRVRRNALGTRSIGILADHLGSQPVPVGTDAGERSVPAESPALIGRMIRS